MPYRSNERRAGYRATYLHTDGKHRSTNRDMCHLLLPEKSLRKRRRWEILPRRLLLSSITPKGTRRTWKKIRAGKKNEILAGENKSSSTLRRRVGRDGGKSRSRTFGSGGKQAMNSSSPPRGRRCSAKDEDVVRSGGGGGGMQRERMSRNISGRDFALKREGSAHKGRRRGGRKTFYAPAWELGSRLGEKSLSSSSTERPSKMEGRIGVVT